MLYLARRIYITKAAGVQVCKRPVSRIGVPFRACAVRHRAVLAENPIQARR